MCAHPISYFSDIVHLIKTLQQNFTFDSVIGLKAKFKGIKPKKTKVEKLDNVKKKQAGLKNKTMNDFRYKYIDNIILSLERNIHRQIEPGVYKVNGKIDWCKSPKIDFEINENESKEIEISDKRGTRVVQCFDQAEARLHVIHHIAQNIKLNLKI